MSKYTCLKTASLPFHEIWNGNKRFELRKNDRDFSRENELYLREWSKDGGFSGMCIYAKVNYIITAENEFGKDGLKKGWCILNLTDIKNGFMHPKDECHWSKFHKV